MTHKLQLLLTQVPPTLSVCSKTVGQNFETSFARCRQAQRPAAPAPITQTLIPVGAIFKPKNNFYRLQSLENSVLTIVKVVEQHSRYVTNVYI